MKVLIACEFSGTVRDAFIACGHQAISCDLLPTEVSGSHYHGNVLDILDQGWDLMVAHPPCVYLSNAARRVWNEPGREEKRLAAAGFFMRLMESGIPRIALENPVGFMSEIYRKPDQYIEPWQFGHPFSKKTGLWLKNLPLLEPTCLARKKETWIANVPGGKDRWKVRSKTFPGIAAAMADQWGKEDIRFPSTSLWETVGIILQAECAS